MTTFSQRLQATVACIFLSLAVLAEGADIRGTITSMVDYDQRDPYASIMVEGKKEADTSVDKASMRITLKTKFFKKQGKERAAAKYADLKMGQKIEAVFDGPVAESYPVQGNAGEIVILDQAEEQPEIKEGNTVTLSGELKGGIMGIGGESTGWRLKLSKGKKTIEVDMSAIKKPQEGTVTIHGKIIKKNYIERGPTLILKATNVEKS